MQGGLKVLSQKQRLKVITNGVHTRAIATDHKQVHCRGQVDRASTGAWKSESLPVERVNHYSRDRHTDSDVDHRLHAVDVCLLTHCGCED